MDEHSTVATYEPPELVELGEFNEDTLGPLGNDLDSYASSFE